MAKKKKTAEEIQGEINALQQLLTNTDYISHKHADGVLTDEEYEEAREQREAWREQIRELRKEITDA